MRNLRGEWRSRSRLHFQAFTCVPLCSVGRNLASAPAMGGISCGGASSTTSTALPAAPSASAARRPPVVSAASATRSCRGGSQHKARACATGANILGGTKREGRVAWERPQRPGSELRSEVIAVRRPHPSLLCMRRPPGSEAPKPARRRAQVLPPPPGAGPAAASSPDSAPMDVVTSDGAPALLADPPAASAGCGTSPGAPCGRSWHDGGKLKPFAHRPACRGGLKPFGGGLKPFGMELAKSRPIPTKTPPSSADAAPTVARLLLSTEVGPSLPDPMPTLAEVCRIPSRFAVQQSNLWPLEKCMPWGKMQTGVVDPMMIGSAGTQRNNDLIASSAWSRLSGGAMQLDCANTYMHIHGSPTKTHINGDTAPRAERQVHEKGTQTIAAAQEAHGRTCPRAHTRCVRHRSSKAAIRPQLGTIRPMPPQVWPMPVIAVPNPPSMLARIRQFSARFEPHAARSRPNLGGVLDRSWPTWGNIARDPEKFHNPPSDRSEVWSERARDLMNLDAASASFREEGRLWALRDGPNWSPHENSRPWHCMSSNSEFRPLQYLLILYTSPPTLTLKQS